MIEQIQKFQKGGNSHQMLRDAEGTFRAAYAKASEDAKRQADALIQSASNYTSANPSVGRNNRLNQAQVYEEATRILRGEGQSQAPSISGGWGNRVINDFYALNKKQTTPATTSTSSKKYTNYTDLNTDYFGIVDDNEDLKARVVRLATNIGNNLASAAKAKGEGSVVRGLDKISDITTLTNTMQNIAKQVENGTMDPRSAQAAILKYAPQLGITDKTAWDAYFGETDDLSQAEKNKAKLTGWTFADNHSNALLNQYLSNNQYRIGTDKEGTQYILDKNYDIVTGKNDTDIEANYYNDGYGSGYAIGQDGRFYVGDNMFSMDQNSPYYTQIKGYVDRIKQQNKDAYVYSKNAFDMNTTLSNHDILNKHAAKFHGKKILDLSRQFGGKQVIATIDNNDFTTAIDPNTGAIDLRNPGLKLYTVNGDNLLEGDYNSLKQYIGDLNLSGEGVASQNITAWNDPQVNLDGLALPRMNMDLNRVGGFWNFFTRDRTMRGNNNKWETGSDADMDIDRHHDISKQVDDAAKYLIYLWGNKNTGELTNVQHRDMARWFADDTTSLEAIAIISRALRENPNLFNEASNAEAARKYKETWQAMLRAYKHKLPSSSASAEVTVQKDGGILYAKEGQLLDIAGNVVNTPDMGESYAASVRRKSNELAADENKVREEAAKYGRTAKQQRAGERWTPQDTLRASALAADVVGLIGAASGVATGGMGNIVAVGSGAVSTILDTVADFSDDAVSAGQAWKNLGLNVGFTAAAAVGGNAPRIVKSAMKLVPKLMMYAGAAGIVFDKEVHNTVSKLTSGEKLSMHDWRNIMSVLRIGAGMGTAGFSAAQAKKGAAAADALYAQNKKALLVDSTIDKNIKYVGADGGKTAIAIDKGVYADINKKLSTGKQEDFDEALSILTRSKTDPDAPGAGLSEDDAAKLIESVAGSKKGVKERLKFWKDAPESKRLRDASAEQIENLTGADVAAEARLKTIEDLRRKHNYDPNSRLSRLAEKFDPTRNQVLAGSGYDNIDDAIVGLRKKVAPISAEKAKNALGALDDAALQQLDVDARTSAKAYASTHQKDIDDLYKQATQAKNDADATVSGIKDVDSKLATLDRDIQSTEAEIKRVQKDINDAPTGEAAETLTKYKDFLAREAEFKQQVKDQFQNEASSMWSKRSDFIDADGNVKPAQAGASAEHEALYLKQLELQYEREGFESSGYIQALNRRTSAEAKLPELQARRAEQARLEQYRLKQRAVKKASKEYEKGKKSFAEEIQKVKDSEYAKKASFVTNTTKEASVQIDGKDVKIPAGASAKSYAYLRDAETAARVAKSNNPNMKEIPKEQYEKLFPSNIRDQIRGAAVDPSTGQVVFWEKGGQIQSKFSHLRK